MALIKCPDCGVEVSDQAAICPKCSRPNPGQTNKLHIQSTNIDRVSKRDFDNTFGKIKTFIFNPIVKKLATYIGVYLLFCSVFAFGYSDVSIYDSILKECGSDSKYCRCLATSQANQRVFLLAPFQTFGIFVDNNAGAHCRR